MKLLNIINNKAELLSNINTERFYVEEVRHFFNLPTAVAKLYCNMAVKQKFFEKKIGVMCPHCHSIRKVIDNYSEMPDSMECDICRDMERDEYEFHPTKANTIEFYKLIKKSK